jgi:protocadherin-16/23
LTVNATDADSESNALIRYSIKHPIAGFTIGEETGILYANLSKIQKPLKSDIQLTVVATDSGNPPLSSTTTIRIHINSKSHIKPHYLQHQYRTTINENTPRGTIVTKLLSIDLASELSELNGIFFEVITGDDEGIFEVTYPDSYLILTKNLDREQNDYYHLRIQMMEVGMQTSRMYKEDNSSIINVFVSVEDTNDEKPVFQANKYEIELSETVPLKHKITKIVAIDNDQPNTPNSEVVYEITSGNDMGMFSIDLVTGILSVNKHLDYDTGTQNYNLIIRACDSAIIQYCTLQTMTINLKDENNHDPMFPVHEYLEFVGENEPIGVSVFTAYATDMDAGEYGKVNYTIQSISDYNDGDDSWKNFKIDAITGVVNTNAIFDYEQRNRYTFNIKAMDIGGKSATVKVKIMIDSRDEFSPQFTERTYRFVLGPSHYLPVGHIIGHVTATDRDCGPDGRVIYQLTTQHAYFKMNRTTGAVILKKKLDSGFSFDSGRDISLVVTASSGRQGSLTNMTVVEIVFDPLADPGTNLASNMNNSGSDESSGIGGWAIGLLVALLSIFLAFVAIFVFLHIKNRRHKHVAKTGITNEAVGNSNSYVDPSAFDTIPIRGSSSSTGQFAPPKYDEIPPYGPHTASSNSGAATTSELSASDQSGSSGRGSAEDDGEDEEIRMINEGLRDGIHDGRLSDVSVHNTQEYLARLGIVDTGPTGNASNSSRRCSESMGLGSTKDSILHHPLPMHMFDEETNDGDLTNLIYAKLNDVTGGSDRASEADEAATTAGSIGINNSVDHVMMSNYSDVPVVVGQPASCGSLSSIVHSEEELTGSYNWDYLLDWGPQYQPLAHVFSEIARLKDDSMSVHSGASAASSAKSKQSALHIKHIPPLITNVAPRSIPVLSARGNLSHHPTGPNHFLLPRSTRSPISHDTTGVFNTSTAMSPSFSPSLSPLATRSPSISPHVSGGHHMVLSRQQPQTRKHQM